MTSIKGVTPLTDAVRCKNCQVVLMLIEAEADVNPPDNHNDFKPLSWAVILEDESIIETLMQKGADVNTT